MLIFLSLVLSHFVADFYLQKNAWIQDKIKHKVKSFGLFLHIMVHLVLNAVVLFLLLKSFSLDYFIALFSIVITHYLIDIWKCYQAFSIKAFLIDQTAHIVVLILVSLYLSGLSLDDLLALANKHITADVVAIMAAYVFLSKPFSFIIQLSLAPYTSDLDAKDNKQGLHNAGEWIGIMERFIVLTLVILGQYAGVGFLLAAKSVFRFGDMRKQNDRKLTEYIMLGSLLSIGMAMVVGIAVKLLIAN